MRNIHTVADAGQKRAFANNAPIIIWYRKEALACNSRSLLLGLAEIESWEIKAMVPPMLIYMSFECICRCQDHYIFWQAIPILYNSSAECLASNIQSAVLFLDLEAMPSGRCTDGLGEEVVYGDVD